ncbi:MAG: serine protease [Lamprobacter sp.]|uniref:trypsin-like serine peptidase n=1 Tax=Lamprobacter sp. TaxID=3100796 RepID=UPI002B257F93|nr:serine protease [Lamprobacter sp.]MEA3642258.1 serine protease [Lamprobacter sp.]
MRQLPPLSVAEVDRQQRLAAGTGRMLIGFGRSVPETMNLVSTPECWQRQADGRWRCLQRLRSPGATGLRLGLQLEALPSGAVLRFHNSDQTQSFTLSAAEAELDSGLYWSPTTVGESVTLELLIPAEADPEQIIVAVPIVSHLFRLPWLQEEVHRETDCIRDVACDKEAERLSRATALILFTDADGETGTCTGTLIAGAESATEIPYLLTAHHCVSDQPKASSVESVWGYRVRECDGSAAIPQWVRGGADLLTVVTSADSSLLRLRHTPPEGAAFVRWSTALPLEGEPVVSIHHPHGAPQKITEGRIKDYLHCEDAAYCGEDADPDGIHYLSVAWTAGVTDSGSSGSGLFLASTGELIGVLSGGLSSCENLEGVDDYGWLGVAYREGLDFWLGQTSESPR